MRPAVQRHKPLAIQLKLDGHDGTRRAPRRFFSKLAIARNLQDAGFFENARVEFHSSFGLVVEPQKWRDPLLHIPFPYVWLQIPARSFLYEFLSDRIQIREALLELLATHIVAIDEEANGFGDEIIFAGHGPGHARLAAFRFEGEFGVVDAFERTEEFEFDLDAFV